MDHISIQPAASIGKDFIPAAYLPPGQDEFYLRNSQIPQPAPNWRHLRAYELEQLVKNGNYADDWDNLLVSEEFDPNQIKNSSFFGLVRIGRLRNCILTHHDMQLPSGITDSRIVSSDIGDDAAIHNVRYLAHYIIGNRCILANIDEMHTTNYAKFGNGIVKDGEPEKVRVWLDLMNEAGCRRVLPFDGMIPADAYLWAKYRDDKKMLDKFKEITQKQFDSRRGYYGTIGDQCVIKNSRILKDVKVGPFCYIKGANKLKNLTINSSPEEPSQIGEGVELVNGIIGYGCHIFYGCKAVRFILGNNSKLKYGARLIHSFLGDNSTISCCEVLNNLIFPSHEQHHNNSFLVAAVVLGQSNMAAGATLGSNHNSRANDNEVQAGRGFWPGLCTSIKHPCRFASFVLMSKGDYPAEMDIPLPFSLLHNNVAQDRLEAMPAFWWLYDMFALSRNLWKLRHRDTRLRKVQKVEFDSLAPDTAEEIFHAMRLLELWTGKARLRQEGKTADGLGEDEIVRIGRDLLAGDGRPLAHMEVLGENMEKSRRKVLILKPWEGYQAYRQMLHYYAVKNLAVWMQANPTAGFAEMQSRLRDRRERNWVNLGGQLTPAAEVDRLRADIGDGKLDTWQQIHQRYDQLWEKYPLEKQKHALATLCALCGAEDLTGPQWIDALNRAASIQQLICDRVYDSRRKDFENPFRQATFRNTEEMLATIGTVEENDFVRQIREDSGQFKTIIRELIQRG